MLNETQIDELIAHGIDYRGGVDRFGGNSAMFEKFIFRYLDDEHYSLLVAAVEAGDAEEGFRVAPYAQGRGGQPFVLVVLRCARSGDRIPPIRRFGVCSPLDAQCRKSPYGNDSYFGAVELN